MGQTLDCFGKGIEITQLHRPEEAIPDSYDKCEPGLNVWGEVSINRLSHKSTRKVKILSLPETIKQNSAFRVKTPN